MSNQIDDFADFLAGITPEERTTLSGLRDGTLVAVKPVYLLNVANALEHGGSKIAAEVLRNKVLAAAPEAPGRG